MNTVLVHDRIADGDGPPVLVLPCPQTRPGSAVYGITVSPARRLSACSGSSQAEHPFAKADQVGEEFSSNVGADVGSS